ncbi:MAG: hypothetical protein Q7R32_08135 [Dehalococcoidia bacterium]|nr:hypothetical protein [Dehalococcoidia bacterium]
MKCDHLTFRANVNVNRLTGPAGTVDAYCADVKIHCEDCGQVFAFLGMDAGYSPDQPRVSYAQDEARLPIVPYGDPTFTSPAGGWRRRAARGGGIVSDTQPRQYRPQRVGPQQVTRIPPYRPGTWVRLVRIMGEEWRGRYGKVRRVKSLACSITQPEQKLAVWLVFFEDGRCVYPAQIERLATDEEIVAADAAERRLKTI